MPALRDDLNPNPALARSPSMLPKSPGWFFTAILAAVPSIARAHDFWIEPSNYRPPASSTVAIRLRVGQDFLGDPVPRPSSAMLLRFDATTATGTAPVIGVQGEEPAGIVEIEGDGMTVVTYHSAPSYVELTEEKLAQYLRDEGLERIHEARRRSPSAGQPWREIYSRCAKSLLWTGQGTGHAMGRRPAAIGNQPVGMPLELIAETNPYAMKAGGALPVRLLYRGQPLRDALIVAIPKMAPNRRIALRSDAQGRVRLKLPSAGEWLIKAVQIVPAPEGARGQWESFWASLTFELPP
jgi:hypothetical protein